KDENATKRQVTSIIIENSPNARPQSGLQDAGIIYEAIAEGGITRFAALYQESPTDSGWSGALAAAILCRLAAAI
ncbi:hypothetical protein PTTG_31192, partial [Puccinia triticina 1-1 BBBD Race 1]